MELLLKGIELYFRFMLFVFASVSLVFLLPGIIASSLNEE